MQLDLITLEEALKKNLYTLAPRLLLWIGHGCHPEEVKVAAILRNKEAVECDARENDAAQNTATLVGSGCLPTTGMRRVSGCDHLNGALVEVTVRCRNWPAQNRDRR